MAENETTTTEETIDTLTATIKENIERLNTAKQNLATAIEAQGVAVSSNATLSYYSGYVAGIRKYWYITPQEFGAVGDGETDDTVAFQNCIDECKDSQFTMYVPEGTYRIVPTTDANCLKISDVNKLDIICHKNAIIELDGTSMTVGKQRHLFRIVNSKNVSITGGTFVGSRYWHGTDIGPTDSSTQEYGIEIRSSSNIILKDLTIKRCLMDGIAVCILAEINNDLNDYWHCENIIFDNVKCIENRRNNIFIGDVNGLFITNCYTSKAGVGDDGISPYKGIDFEPNYACEYIRNVSISNCIFDNDRDCGINCTLLNKEPSIQVNDCKFINTKIGFKDFIDVNLKDDKYFNDGDTAVSVLRQYIRNSNLEKSFNLDYSTTEITLDTAISTQITDFLFNHYDYANDYLNSNNDLLLYDFDLTTDDYTIISDATNNTTTINVKVPTKFLISGHLTFKINYSGDYEYTIDTDLTNIDYSITKTDNGLEIYFEDASTLSSIVNSGLTVIFQNSTLECSLQYQDTIWSYNRLPNNGGSIIINNATFTDKSGMVFKIGCLDDISYQLRINNCDIINYYPKYSNYSESASYLYFALFEMNSDQTVQRYQKVNNLYINNVKIDLNTELDEDDTRIDLLLYSNAIENNFYIDVKSINGDDSYIPKQRNLYDDSSRCLNKTKNVFPGTNCMINVNTGYQRSVADNTIYCSNIFKVDGSKTYYIDNIDTVYSDAYFTMIAWYSDFPGKDSTNMDAATIPFSTEGIVISYINHQNLNKDEINSITAPENAKYAVIQYNNNTNKKANPYIRCYEKKYTGFGADNNVQIKLPETSHIKTLSTNLNTNYLLNACDSVTSNTFYPQIILAGEITEAHILNRFTPRHYKFKVINNSTNTIILYLDDLYTLSGENTITLERNSSVNLFKNENDIIIIDNGRSNSLTKTEQKTELERLGITISGNICYFYDE